MTARLSPFYLLIPVIMLAGVVLMAITPAIVAKPHISEALSLDLLVSIPFVWFLVIRKRSIPNITVVPVLILCTVVGYQVLPESQHSYLNAFESFVLPFIELGVLAFVITKVVQLRKLHKAQQATHHDFFTSLNTAVGEVLPPKIAPFFALEVSMFYYAFGRLSAKNRPEGFTYHKESGVKALYIVLVFIIMVETVALHVLLHNWNPIVAWVLTGLSLYTAVQFTAFTRSLGARPILIQANVLFLRYGIMANVDIDLDSIEKAYSHTSDLPEDKSVHKLGLLGALEQHNVILELKEEVVIKGLYGKKIQTSKIALWLDEPSTFIKAVTRNDV